MWIISYSHLSKVKSTGFCGVSFPPSTSHSRPFRNIRFPSESYHGISNFGNLPDVVNQGREFSFFRYIQIKNVKYWHLHLHKTFNHLIWQVHLKELTLLKLIKYILVTPSRSLQLILKKHYNFFQKGILSTNLDKMISETPTKGTLMLIWKSPYMFMFI